MKKIILSGIDIIRLIRGESIESRVKEYYFDQDAQDYLLCGSDSEWVTIEGEKK